MSYESGIVWTVNPDIYFSSSHVTRSRQVLYGEYSRWCREQCFRLFTSKTSVSSLITCVQLNLAIITVHFSYAKRWRGHSQASFDIGRTNWMPIKKLKEQSSAWWGSFVSETVSFCGRMVRAISHYPKITFQTSWRNESESAYLWTRKFNLNTLCVDVEIFESGKKNLRIQTYPDSCERDLSEVSNL